MSLYRSFIPVDLSDKCIISFDVDFTENDKTAIGFGYYPSRVTTDTAFNKILYIDNRWIYINRSTLYQKSADGKYIYKKKVDNSEFFGYKLFIDDNGKVFEEIKDGNNFDIKTDTDWIEVSSTLYKHYPGKYVYENGIVKLNINYTNITAFYIVGDKGETTLEKYVFDSDMQQYKGRIRFIITGKGTVIDASRSNDKNAFESIVTALYNDNDIPSLAYIYLTYEGITPKNFLINYKGEV